MNKIEMKALEYYKEAKFETRFFHVTGEIWGGKVNIVVNRVNLTDNEEVNMCSWGQYDVNTKEMNPMFIRSSLVLEEHYQKNKQSLTIPITK